MPHSGRPSSGSTSTPAVMAGLAARHRLPRPGSSRAGVPGQRAADAIISAQANEARHAGVSATPTLHLIDHDSGLSLTLPGPAEGDALLSALDLLASGVANPDIADPHSECLLTLSATCPGSH